MNEREYLLREEKERIFYFSQFICVVS